MRQEIKRPSPLTMANDNTKNYADNIKQFACLRKDLNELIIVVNKLYEIAYKNNRGALR